NAISLGCQCDAQCADNCLYLQIGNGLTNDLPHRSVTHIESKWRNGMGIIVGYSSIYMPASQFRNKQRRSLQRKNRHVGISTTLESERCIGFQPMPLSGFTHRHRIEIGTFQEYTGGTFRYSRVHAAENARDT